MMQLPKFPELVIIKVTKEKEEEDSSKIVKRLRKTMP